MYVHMYDVCLYKLTNTQVDTFTGITNGTSKTQLGFRYRHSKPSGLFTGRTLILGMVFTLGNSQVNNSKDR